MEEPEPEKTASSSNLKPSASKANVPSTVDSGLAGELTAVQPQNVSDSSMQQAETSAVAQIDAIERVDASPSALAMPAASPLPQKSGSAVKQTKSKPNTISLAPASSTQVNDLTRSPSATHHPQTSGSNVQSPQPETSDGVQTDVVKQKNVSASSSAHVIDPERKPPSESRSVMQRNQPKSTTTLHVKSSSVNVGSRTQLPKPPQESGSAMQQKSTTLLTKASSENVSEQPQSPRPPQESGSAMQQKQPKSTTTLHTKTSSRIVTGIISSSRLPQESESKRMQQKQPKSIATLQTKASSSNVADSTQLPQPPQESSSAMRPAQSTPNTTSSTSVPTAPVVDPAQSPPPRQPQESDSMKSWAASVRIADEINIATTIQDEEANERSGQPKSDITSNINIHEPVKWTPSQQRVVPASSAAASEIYVVHRVSPLAAKLSFHAIPPPALTLSHGNNESNISLASNMSTDHGGLRPAPSSLQPVILETTSTENFDPYTRRGRVSVAIGEPVEISYEKVQYTPSAITLTGGMAQNLVRYAAAGGASPAATAKAGAQKDTTFVSEKPATSTPKKSPTAPALHSVRVKPGERHPLSTKKTKAETSSDIARIRSPNKKSSQTDRYKRTFSTSSQSQSVPLDGPRQKKGPTVPPNKSKQHMLPSPEHNALALEKQSSTASARSGRSNKNAALSEKPSVASKKSDVALNKTGSKTAVRRPSTTVQPSPPKKIKTGAAETKSKSSMGKRKEPRTSRKHEHGQHFAAKYRQPSVDETAMAAGEGRCLSLATSTPIPKTKAQRYSLVIPPEEKSVHKVCSHERKRIHLTDEQRQSAGRNSSGSPATAGQEPLPRTSGGQPLPVAPLTRCQSGEKHGRRSANKLYHYPSFSGRSSADCEYIEVVGAARPPIETALTQAIFDNAEHVRLIDEVDKLTGGPRNYRNERELEDMYGLRVKKFWDRYQLHGTAYLDHLRKNPKYSEMPPSVQRKTKELHANNEHLCQHLYYIKSAACSPYIDNRLPARFKEMLNVDAEYRAKAWRKRTELNYKLFLNVLKTRPFCIDAEECLRESLRRLSWQVFIAKQPNTIKWCKKRLAYNTNCLLDPDYDQHGPSWWRPLSSLEQKILKELIEVCDVQFEGSSSHRNQQAHKNDSDVDACSAMRRLGIHFEQFHLQEALDMCNYGRGATSVGDVGDPLELLYYLRLTPPIRDGPYKFRSLFFVGIVKNTPHTQIVDIRETMKHFLNWRKALAEMHKIRHELAGEPKWPKKVFERLRNIRDAMQIHPGSPYSHINIRWLMYNNKIARQYVQPGPFHIKDNLREFQQWAASKHYIITKLPDFGRLPQFSNFYVKALQKFRPPERVFLDNR